MDRRGIYTDAGLVEVSGTPTGEVLDRLIVVSADELEVTWRFRHETRPKRLLKALLGLHTSLALR